MTLSKEQLDKALREVLISAAMVYADRLGADPIDVGQQVEKAFDQAIADNARKTSEFGQQDPEKLPF